ncbi:hypothetical protein LOZ53_003308 [Ophidiomyces ophidiicola]|nr:hypothetical protein LOZ53_003308 [Ophidiomyces ophidiicola]
MRGCWLLFDISALYILFLLPLFAAELESDKDSQDDGPLPEFHFDNVCRTADLVDTPVEDIWHPMCLRTKKDDLVAETVETTLTVEPVLDVPIAASSTPTIGPKPDPELDTESPLDNSKFLSFEDWKKKNLAKAGQSADNVRGNRQGSASSEKRRRSRPGEINNALESLGEEGEIELAFGDFTPGSSDVPPLGGKDDNGPSSTSEGEKSPTESAEGDSQADGVTRRGPNRRKDAGTTCKERFNYASFDCAATVLKTNRECTGSSSVLIENKDSYMLNECRAKDKFVILELCDDILVDTIVLANYEFFSSIFRTFRVSVSDRYPTKPDKWKELGTYEAANTRGVQVFAVENPLIWARYLKIEFLSHYGKEFYCPISLIRVHGTTMMEEYKNDGETARPDDEPTETAQSQEPSAPASVAGSSNQTQDGTEHQNTSLSIFHPGAADLPSEGGLGDLCFPEMDEIEKLLLRINLHNTSSIYDPVPEPEYSPESHVHTDNDAWVAATTGTVGLKETPLSDSVASSAGNTSHQKTGVEPRGPSTSRPPKPENETIVESQKPRVTSQPPPPNPTTQESFFKSVHKRLQMLETNSSLSLLYIEEQSRILRDAFNKVEKRQLAKTSAFLENMNATVLNELREFRQQYDHIWNSVVIELEQQRQQYHHELFAVTTQLGILADEVVFQKRISIIQSVFVLLCFGLVLFSRSAIGSYLELSKMQSVVSRTQSFRSASPSYETPSASPNSTRQISSYQKRIMHQRHASDYQADCELCNPAFTYSPPQTSAGVQSPPEEEEKELHDVNPEYSRSTTSLVVPDENPRIMKRQLSSPPDLGTQDALDSSEAPVAPP